MDDYEKIFKKVCRKYKFRVFDATKPNPLRMEHQILEINCANAGTWIRDYKNLHCKKMPTCYFGYVDDAHLNAFAFHEKSTNCGYLAIFTGCVWLTYDLFYRLLSHPAVLPTIGDVSRETLRRSIYSEELHNDFTVVCRQRNAKHDKFSAITPNDPERKKYAEKLAQIALEFLVLHELAHVANGHCEFENSLGIPLLFELNQMKSAMDPLAKQWFEVTADAHASNASWLRRLRRPTESEKLSRSLLQKDKEIVVPSELLMFDWVFAVTFLFWMFDIDTDPQSLHTATHPPAPQRVIWANAHVYGMVQKNGSKEALDQWDRARIKAARLSEEAMRAIGAKKTIKKIGIYYALEQDGTILRHLDRVMEEGNKIAFDLEKFSHYDYPRPKTPRPPKI